VGPVCDVAGRLSLSANTGSADEDGGDGGLCGSKVRSPPRAGADATPSSARAELGVVNVICGVVREWSEEDATSDGRRQVYVASAVIESCSRGEVGSVLKARCNAVKSKRQRS
jgi:hypothetical protein